MDKRKGTAEQIEKRRFWKEHIDTWRIGNLNQSQYCRRHGLKHQRFVYWKRKFSAAETSSVSLVEVSVPKIFQPPFHSSQASALKVAFGDKYKVEVAPGFDPVTLKEVLLTLGQL